METRPASINGFFGKTIEADVGGRKELEMSACLGWHRDGTHQRLLDSSDKQQRIITFYDRVHPKFPYAIGGSASIVVKVEVK